MQCETVALVLVRTAFVMRESDNMLVYKRLEPFTPNIPWRGGTPLDASVGPATGHAHGVGKNCEFSASQCWGGKYSLITSSFSFSFFALMSSGGV